MSKFSFILTQVFTIQMKKKEESKCPICGRLAPTEVVRSFDRRMDEVKMFNAHLECERKALLSANRRLTDENARLQRALAQHEQAEGTLHGTIADQAKHILGLEAEVRITRYDLTTAREQLDITYRRNWWQRLLNIYPDDE